MTQNYTKDQLTALIKDEMAARYRTQWQFCCDSLIPETVVSRVLKGKGSDKAVQRVAHALGFQVALKKQVIVNYVVLS